jgi:hypothetical protein
MDIDKVFSCDELAIVQAEQDKLSASWGQVYFVVILSRN